MHLEPFCRCFFLMQVPREIHQDFGNPSFSWPLLFLSYPRLWWMPVPPAAVPRSIFLRCRRCLPWLSLNRSNMDRQGTACAYQSRGHVMSTRIGTTSGRPESEGRLFHVLPVVQHWTSSVPYEDVSSKIQWLREYNCIYLLLGPNWDKEQQFLNRRW